MLPSTLTQRPATSRPDPIALIERILDADGPPAADDIAAIVQALRRAAAGNGSIEQALGLAPVGWHRVLAQRRRDAALASLRMAGSARAAAARLHADLGRYARSARFKADRARGAPADPADEVHFVLLSAYGGRVVSLSTIRRLTRWLKNDGEMSHATSENHCMTKSKKPADPANMSPEELDEFLADIRLPQLRRDRAELTRRLAEMFASIGYAIDWDWQPNNEANEVAIILTGRAAPAEQSMPAPALHAALQRRRDAIDKAIHVAQRAAQRAADRRIEQRIAANLPEIHAVARERALLAVRLQRANRALFEMEQDIGIDPRFGLPSSGFDLLGVPAPGDEVDVLVDALVGAGILSRKDVLNAGQ
jgi:hypothetical protein